MVVRAVVSVVVVVSVLTGLGSKAAMTSSSCSCVLIGVSGGGGGTGVGMEEERGKGNRCFLELLGDGVTVLVAAAAAAAPPAETSASSTSSEVKLCFLAQGDCTSKSMLGKERWGDFSGGLSNSCGRTMSSSVSELLSLELLLVDGVE